ncbi:MAG: hypothetical protein RLY95_32 [Pseudomonadota bacterium]
MSTHSLTREADTQQLVDTEVPIERSLLDVMDALPCAVPTNFQPSNLNIGIHAASFD